MQFERLPIDYRLARLLVFSDIDKCPPMYFKLLKAWFKKSPEDSPKFLGFLIHPDSIFRVAYSKTELTNCSASASVEDKGKAGLLFLLVRFWRFIELIPYVEHPSTYTDHKEHQSIALSAIEAGQQWRLGPARPADFVTLATGHVSSSSQIRSKAL